MDMAFLEKLDLKTLERVSVVLFDQMGFTAKSTAIGAMPGIGEVMVLYSKTSNAPFALLQCARSGAKVEVDALNQIKNAMARLALTNAYLVTVDTPGVAVRDFAAASKINLVDGVKFVDLMKNLSENGRNLLRQALSPERAAKPAEAPAGGFGTGRYPKLVEAPAGGFGTGRYPRLGGAKPGAARPTAQSGPPLCAKCGASMHLQIRQEGGPYKTGKFWLCPRPGCGYICAYLD